MARADIVRRAEETLAGPIDNLGYELVACDYRTVGGRPTLQVFIDREGSVTIRDCVTVNRAIGDLLEVEGLGGDSYDLEVSSPGLDRILRKEDDFRRFAGREVRVRTFEPVEGRRNYRGRIGSVEDGIVRLRVDGQDHDVPIAAMDRANLVVDPFAGTNQGKGKNKRKKQ